MYKTMSKEEMAMIIGYNVRYVREGTTYKQGEVAEKIGTGRTSYVNIERGVVVPKMLTLLKLANLFNVKIERFLQGIEV